MLEHSSTIVFLTVNRSHNRLLYSIETDQLCSNTNLVMQHRHPWKASLIDWRSALNDRRSVSNIFRVLVTWTKVRKVHAPEDKRGKIEIFIVIFWPEFPFWFFVLFVRREEKEKKWPPELTAAPISGGRNEARALCSWGGKSSQVVVRSFDQLQESRARTHAR